MPAKLGQNFLVNRDIIRRLIAAFQPVTTPVLEIGPGRGVLTEPLAEVVRAAGQRLVAVEIDALLAAALRERLAPGVTIVTADIRDVDPAELFAADEIAVIGNVPYFISRDIVDWLLAHRRRIARGQLLLQREFAAKLLAPPGGRAYHAQGVLFQHLFTARKLLAVSPGSFRPVPRVMSEVIAFESRHRAAGDDAAYYRFLKCAFAARRKTLANNLQTLRPAAAAHAALEGAGVAPARRAEELTGEQLYSVFRHRDD